MIEWHKSDRYKDHLFEARFPPLITMLAAASYWIVRIGNYQYHGKAGGVDGNKRAAEDQLKTALREVSKWIQK